MTDRFADWDAAYVLGALTPLERVDYEAHLRTCSRCAAAVADLEPLPPALSRLTSVPDPPLIAPTQDPDTAIGPPSRSHRWWASWLTLIARAASGLGRPRRFGRALVLTTATLAVLTLAALTLFTTGMIRPTTEPGPERIVALSPVMASPLRAKVALTTTTWGTRVDLTCSYARGYGGQRDYRLVLVDSAGTEVQVAEWHAEPGDLTAASGSTRLPISAIRQVQLQRLDGTVLLARGL